MEDQKKKKILHDYLAKIVNMITVADKNLLEKIWIILGQLNLLADSFSRKRNIQPETPSNVREANILHLQHKKKKIFASLQMYSSIFKMVSTWVV